VNTAGTPDGTAVDLLFDARHIRQSGIGTYISQQLPLLQERLTQHRLSLAILADPTTAPRVGENTVVIFSRPSAAPMYSIQEQKAWDDALRCARPRAVWLPHYPFPFTLFRRCNRRILTFVTVHDTLHLLEKRISGQSWAHRMYARTMLHIDARRCNQIFAVSATTAESLRRVVPSAPVMVAPQPVDPLWFTPADPDLSPVRGKYIIYVGNVKHHKNLPLLLNAYAEIAHAIPQKKLVIAGGGESVRALDSRVQPLTAQLGDRVQVIGRLDFDELRSLVAGADLLVMPSLYEGVGMPPLEAMASRTAVLSSNIAALRETCGEGAEYFDPRDPHGLACLIRTYGCDDDARAAVAAKGWSYGNERQSRLSFTTAVDAVCSALDRNRGP
jgi:glycosyltransferase involved in cell wall biosynthesis